MIVITCLLSGIASQRTLAQGAAHREPPRDGLVLPDAPVASARFPGRYEFAQRRPARRSAHAALIENTESAAGSTGSADITITASIPDERILIIQDGNLLGVHSNTHDPDIRASIYSVREGTIDGPQRPLTMRFWHAAAEALGSQNRVHGWIPAT